VIAGPSECPIITEIGKELDGTFQQWVLLFKLPVWTEKAAYRSSYLGARGKATALTENLFAARDLLEDYAKVSPNRPWPKGGFWEPQIGKSPR
jgi:hypothetical protein